MEDMGKKTALSREESAKFLKQIQDSTKGVKVMGTEMSDLAKTLSDEFGPRLQDIQNGFKTLAEIQQKDIMLFSRIREGMRGPEFGNYVASMVLAHKLTNEQAETLLRVNRQKVLGSQAVDEETKKLRQFQDVQQKFQQAFSNLAISLGKPLMEIFVQVIKPLSAFGDKLSTLMEKNKAFAGMVGGVAKILAWSAIAATVVGAMSAMASKLSAAFQLIKSVAGAGASKIVNVRIVGGGGPESVAAHLKGSSAVAAGAEKVAESAPKVGVMRRMGQTVGRSVAMHGGGVKGVLTASASGAIGVLGRIASFLGPIGLVVGAITALASVLLPLVGNFDSIGKVLGMAEGEIDNLNASFAEIKTLMLDAFGEIWKTIKDVGKSLIVAIMPMVKLYQQVIPPILSAFTPMAQSLIKALAAIFGAFMKLQIIMMKIILPIATVAFQALAKVLEWAAGIIESVFNKISETFDSLMPYLDEFADAVGAATDSLLGRERNMDAMNKRNMESIQKGHDKTAAGKFGDFYAKEMGVKREDVDDEKLAERVKQITGKGMQAAWNDPATRKTLQTDVRLTKAGVDVTKPGEAAIGIGRISAIQEELTKDLATRKAGGEGEEGQKKYRERMEQAAAQGNMMIMSRAMQDALMKHSKDAGTAQKTFAGAPAEFKTFLDPTKVKEAVDQIKSGTEYATLFTQRLIQANAYYDSLSQTISAANGLLSENAEAALNLGNNTQMYKQYLGEAMELSNIQLSAARAIADASKEGLNAERQSLEIQLKKAIANKDIEETRKVETALIQNSNARASIQNNINKALSEQLKIGLQIVEANKQEIEVRDAELGLLESQMQLSKAMFAGMGPTLAIQGQMLSKLDEQIEAYQKQNEEARKQIEALKRDKDIKGEIPAYQKKILENENKMTQAKLKQVELTKALRDQYLEAITSFTQMEGAFSKLIISRESGVGEAMRNYGMQGGLGVGVQGAGATSPLMQWGAGGNVQFQPMQQMMNFFKQYQGAAGYSDVKGMVPFSAGWAEGTPAGSSMLQGFNSAEASKEKMNQMTHASTGPGGATPKGPPLDGGLNVINDTLKAILKAITDQSSTAIVTPKGMSIGGIVKMAGGGKLPGYGGGDSVPALLEQGEFVINKDAAKAYAPLLMAINAQKFASGGPVIPKPETALAAAGGSPRVNINVRGDSAAAIKKVVMDELDASLDATMSPTGSHARLYDPTL